MLEGLSLAAKEGQEVTKEVAPIARKLSLGSESTDSLSSMSSSAKELSEETTIQVAKKPTKYTRKGKGKKGGAKGKQTSSGPSKVKDEKGPVENIGMHLMKEKMGHIEGEGLGRNSDGISEAIRAKYRAPGDRSGLGYEAPEQLNPRGGKTANPFKRKQQFNQKNDAPIDFSKPMKFVRAGEVVDEPAKKIAKTFKPAAVSKPPSALAADSGYESDASSIDESVYRNFFNVLRLEES